MPKAAEVAAAQHVGMNAIRVVGLRRTEGWTLVQLPAPWGAACLGLQRGWSLSRQLASAPCRPEPTEDTVPSPTTAARTPVVREANATYIEGFLASTSWLFAEDAGPRDSAMNLVWPRQFGPDFMAELIADKQRLVLLADDGDRLPVI